MPAPDVLLHAQCSNDCGFYKNHQAGPCRLIGCGGTVTMLRYTPEPLPDYPHKLLTDGRWYVPIGDFERLLHLSAMALERVQVADDRSGAADEAEMILSQGVTLSGEYVPKKDSR